MSGSAAISTLCENPTEVFLDVSRLLITYADNILRNPNEEKYRSIRIGNATFSTKLLPVKGAVECLFEMGFEEAETHLVFPQSASVGKLRQVRENIAAERNQRLETSTPSPSPSAAALPFTSSSVTFLRSLQSNFQHVLVYERADLQQKALSFMPHALLRSRAEERLGRAREADPDCTLETEDMLVLDLLQWFKGEFFSWVDSLPCGQCGGKTQASGSLQPSDDDRRWDAGRVENHYCETCQISTRFPRYNHPEKLLESRRGRCGEWANCFTLCCRALGLEARYIWDSTDHVWTEVFSQSQGRWVHCDPCENACDKPLLYEVGWGKKLSYILAFSKDQVVDVTWRYSCKHQEVLSRRSQVQETWLLHTLNNLNSTRQQSLGAQRKQQLLERLLMEQVEFISPKSPQSGDLGGRVSGSLAWRAARGETGNARKDATERVFVPSEAEKREKRFHICYNMVKDCYFRPSSGQETITGWQSGAWRIENVFRKEEHDWKMVYLARTEGAAFGRISWKFNCSSSGMIITSASVRASSQTFHSGSVCWSLISPHNTTQFPADGEFHSGVNVAGSGELMVEAELTGGDGDEAWQHAQLFRQSLTDTQTLSLEILVEMEESQEHPSTSL